MNNESSSFKQAEYHITENDVHEIPQSLELSGDEEEMYQTSQEQNQEDINRNCLQPYNHFSALHSDNCFDFTINGRPKPNASDKEPSIVYADRSNEIRELRQVINCKEKQIYLLARQNDQLKTTVSNLVIQAKQSKAFDKVSTEGKLGLTYADMILALPSMKRDIEMKENRIKELDNAIRELVQSLEQGKDERTALEQQTAQTQKALESVMKKADKLEKDKEKSASLLKDKQNEAEALLKQLEVFKEGAEKRKRTSMVMCQQTEYAVIGDISSDDNEKQREASKENALQVMNDNVIKDNEALSKALDEALSLNKEYEQIINNKQTNETELTKDNELLMHTIVEYENEIKHLTENITLLTSDKTKTESLYLDQISQLQNERNYFEGLLHKNTHPSPNNRSSSNQSPPFYNQKETLLSISHIISECRSVLHQLKQNSQIDPQMIYLLFKAIIETLENASQCINKFHSDLQSYRNDNKKLYDNNQSTINHNSYVNDVLSLLITKHVTNQSIGATVKSLLSKQIELERLLKAKAQLKAKLSTYASFINTMNLTSTVNQSLTSFYKKNYSTNDFNEISAYNNSLIDIELNINALHLDIRALESQLNSY